MRRLSNKRIDPITGIEYNTEVNPPKTEQVAARLMTRKEDEAPAVKKRFAAWTQNIVLIEEAYKSKILVTSADKTVEYLTENIHQAIENPVF